MRENRMSGSKGGEARLNAPFLPLSDSQSWFCVVFLVAGSVVSPVGGSARVVRLHNREFGADLGDLT
jgi:hypothetical protein